MKSTDILSISKSMVRSKLFGQHVPIAVSWALTYHCNLRCQYCKVWDIPRFNPDELTTEQTCAIFDELLSMGLKFVSFTGGEPLLRDDIGAIMRHVTGRGAYVSLSSNGILLPDKIDQIMGVDKVNLSLDGPLEIHEKSRGKNTYESVITAIKVLKENNIRVVISTVLTKYNLQHLDFILDLAAQYGLGVYFQPGLSTRLGDKSLNHAVPFEEDCRKAIAYLIQLKQSGNRHILNSVPGLQHLLHWPNETKIPCTAGKIFFRIEPNGCVRNCSRFFDSEFKPSSSHSLIALGVKEAIRKVKEQSCLNCWCASVVEFNLAWGMDFNSIMNILGRLINAQSR